MSDLQNGLRRSRLFEGVPAALVAAAAAGSETRELSAGDVLLRFGAENDALYVVPSGRVSVRVPGADHPYIRLGAGECVGELSFIDRQPVSADVVADEPTLVLALNRDQVWSLIESSAESARNLLRILAGRVRDDDVALGEMSQKSRQLEHLATVDGLTGLRNRRWFEDAFARQLARAARVRQPLSVLMIDIDYFKDINDAHGHTTGDAVLRRVAQKLATELRPQDLLARYGGDEFVVVLPGLELLQAVAVAERLREGVRPDADPASASGLGTTVSIGVAAAEPDDLPVALLNRADEALYRAKQSGRNSTRT